jgi:FAD/FMN-containing dehydrogenase
MNKIVDLNAKRQLIAVEPGASFEKVQDVLKSHGLFLPACPASAAYATIAGGIASNVVGKASAKYGAINDYVQRLRVVLVNGEVIETEPLGKKELSHKLGLASLEGEIYRSIDTLIEENSELINSEAQKYSSAPNLLGYNLHQVKTDKAFDLTPLFVGSLGTLGLITEATLLAAPYNPRSTYVAASLPNTKDLQELLPQITKLGPSVFDFVSRGVLEMVSKINPSQLTGAVENPNAEIHLFIEFDNHKESDQKRLAEKLQKIFEKHGVGCWIAKTDEEIAKLDKIRQSISTVLSPINGPKRAIPMAEDIYVPPPKLAEFLQKSLSLCEKNDIEPALWGDAGLGLVRLMPMLDLAQVGDRQKLHKVSEAAFKLASELGGAMSATSDGRVRAPYLPEVFSPEYYQLILKVKKIFDPQKILNQGVKTISGEEMKKLLRDEYSFNTHHRAYT